MLIKTQQSGAAYLLNLPVLFSEAPQRPVIRVESKRDRLEEGDILKLKCEAIDGEPEGKLSWLKGGFVQQFVSPTCMGSNPDSVCVCVCGVIVILSK